MSAENHEMPEGHLHWSESEYSTGRSEVWKTIWILSAVTVVEVMAALAYDHFMNGGPKWPINLFVAIMSVIKVIYIMGTFMHLKHETKGFFMTVAFSFSFLIWAIIAFSYEGGSWQHMRSILNVF
ncbi:MAG: cytochrome C oxidase subunit IV family protein [Chitinophagales bacterium]